ncbi:7-carboxy-7-deazaguanine synthase QueE [Thermodesulforhabdus norvegica]|uniref:7-carboxy-7-deazaguanine synthase n=1 Tax=Thermodesulforhabdus norvegica TaxID=39841 RepID=A0A1I4SMB5_9BACT|nr:radical SAM protein [Thermodesulforhabdus norvegica]SFM65668.1 7-carboxy-7-deazaguanine synthase [Thermodesulforhabdus norvegica]
MGEPGIFVSEMFISIQGESSFAGWPCVFIRTAGCNLKCTYCDTLYARNGGRKVTLRNCLRFVEDSGLKLVEITGGEPLLQEELPRLVKMLIDREYTVLIETNGSLDISPIPEKAIRIMDIKCPSSGMMHKNDYENLKRLHPADEVKFVIGNFEDYLFASQWARRVLEESPVRVIHFSPVFGLLEPSTLAEWILKDKIPVRLNLQLHKYIWSPDAKGV